MMYWLRKKGFAVILALVMTTLAALPALAAETHMVTFVAYPAEGGTLSGDTVFAVPDGASLEAAVPESAMPTPEAATGYLYRGIAPALETITCDTTVYMLFIPEESHGRLAVFAADSAALVYNGQAQEVKGYTASLDGAVMPYSNGKQGDAEATFRVGGGIKAEGEGKDVADSPYPVEFSGAYVVCEGERTILQSNIEYVFLPGSLWILPRPVTLTVKDAVMKLGDALPEFEISVTGGSLAEGETIEDLGVTVSIDEEGVGVHPLVITAANPNYAVTAAPATVTVEGDVAISESRVPLSGPAIVEADGELAPDGPANVPDSGMDDAPMASMRDEEPTEAATDAETAQAIAWDEAAVVVRFEDAVGNVLHSVAVARGETIALPDDIAAPDGYRLAYWYDAGVGEQAPYVFGTPVTGPLVLMPVYTLNEQVLEEALNILGGAQGLEPLDLNENEEIVAGELAEQILAVIEEDEDPAELSREALEQAGVEAILNLGLVVEAAVEEVAVDEIISEPTEEAAILVETTEVETPEPETEATDAEEATAAEAVDAGEAYTGMPTVSVEYSFGEDLARQPTVTVVARIRGLPTGAVVVQYQWQNDANGDYEDVEGATAETYTFPMGAYGDGCHWRVQVLIEGVS